jgi:hypothetical protein
LVAKDEIVVNWKKLITKVANYLFSTTFFMSGTINIQLVNNNSKSSEENSLDVKVLTEP